MAFQKEIPDIPADARPIVAPDVSSGAVAQGIQNIGQIAGNTVKDIQKSKARGEISDISQVATTVSAAVEQGGASVFNEEGDIEGEGLTPELEKQVRQAKEKAGARFNRIAASVRQGSLPQQAAALEAEAAVKELVNQTPGFEQEIRQQARDLLGYDPTGFALRQTLGIPSGSQALTESQKRRQRAEAIVGAVKKLRPESDITVDTVMGLEAIRDMNQIRAEAADAEMDAGTISFTQWTQESLVSRGPDLSDTLAGIAELGAEGGVQSPEQYTNVIVQQREADLRTLREKAAQFGGVNSEEFNRAADQVRKMYTPILQAVKDNDLGTILDRKLDTVAKLHKRYAQQATPKLAMISAAYGDQVAGQIIDMWGSISDPAQRDLILEFEPGLKRILESGDMTQNEMALGALGYVDKIFQNQPVGEEDLKFRHMAETFIASPGNTDLREEYVRNLGNTGAPIRAVSLLSSKVPRAVATDGEVEFFRNQFNTHVGQQAQESLPGNLVDTISREIRDMNQQNISEELHVNDRGKLVITGQFFGGVPSDMQTNAMKKIQPYLDAVQKGWAQDFRVDKNTFNTEIINRVNERIALLDKQEEGELKEKADSIFDFYNTMNFTYGGRKRQGAEENGEAPAPEEVTPEEQTYRKNTLMPFLVRNEGRGNFNPTTNTHRVYKDDAGYRTIGYGHRLQEGEDFEGGIIEQEARQLLAQDLRSAELGARNMFDDMMGEGSWDKLAPNERAALIDVQFNVAGGISKFPNFSKAIRDGNYKQAMKEIAERGYSRESDGKFVHLQKRNNDLIKTFLAGGVNQ